MDKLRLALLVNMAMCGTAHAQTPSGANLLQDWLCPTAQCETKCTGPFAELIVMAKDVKVFQFAMHTRRLWLLADGVAYVLGDDDRCRFGGKTTTPIEFISTPLSSSSLGPTLPNNAPCFGSHC